MKVIRNEPIGELWMKIRSHKRLARLMVVQEVTHRQVAAAAGWRSHSIVGRMVRGEVATIEPERALRIANFLQTPVDDLFVTQVSSISAQVAQSEGAA